MDDGFRELDAALEPGAGRHEFEYEHAGDVFFGEGGSGGGGGGGYGGALGGGRGGGRAGDCGVEAGHALVVGGEDAVGGDVDEAFFFGVVFGVEVGESAAAEDEEARFPGRH